MVRPEPRLQSKLLRWLLGPLLILLFVDTAVTYWAALRFSNRAHDRSLLELAREVGLHVKAEERGPRLELSPAAERVLLIDQDDRLAYRVSAVDGRLLGGDAQIDPPPVALLRGAAPMFYGGVHQGAPVRMAAAWLPIEGHGPKSDTVLVQVAETMNKRNRLAWEILASVVVPQLLLIVMASTAVYFGVSRGLMPLQKLRRSLSDRSHLDLTPLDLAGAPGEVRPLGWPRLTH